jgi:hypothetical protein
MTTIIPGGNRTGETNMNEWDRVVILKAIVEAQIEAMGMEAENMQRQATGNSVAYTYDNFATVINCMNAIFEAHRT